MKNPTEIDWGWLVLRFWRPVAPHAPNYQFDFQLFGIGVAIQAHPRRRLLWRRKRQPRTWRIGGPMKKGIILVFLLVAASAAGQSIVVPPATIVTWDDPNPAGLVDGYPMYCTDTSPVVQDPANLMTVIPYPGVTWTLPFVQGHKVCAVAALSGTVESTLSNEIEFDVLGGPVNFRVVVPD